MTEHDPEVAAHVLAFVEQSGDFVGVSDPWGRILYLNPAAAKRLGVADADGLTLADLFPFESFGFYYEVVRPELLRSGAWSGEVLVNVAGSGPVPMYVSTTARLGPGGETLGGVVYAHELTGRVPRVVDATDVDNSTGLLTTVAFYEHASAALAEAARERESCALVLADIGGMPDDTEPAGNDTAAGVLRSLAARLLRLSRSIDIGGRLGDGQLALLLRGVRGESEALRFAAAASESLANPPVPTARGDIVVSVACGVALARPGDSLADLVDRATTRASEQAWLRPSEVPAYRAAQQSDAITMDQFRLGMSHGDVRPYVQSVVEIPSGRPVGYRAFARWNHRTRGPLEPSAFVDMIAETELAKVIDLYVAREAVTVLLLATRDAPLCLYTPVSKQLIADVHTEQYLTEIAEAFFVSPEQMHLQVAQHFFDDWSPALSDALYSLRAAGFRVTLTGVAEPDGIDGMVDVLDELQIARRLTHAAATDADAHATLVELVGLARARGLRVVGAGVDRREHFDVLTESGCDLAYGDLFGVAEAAHTVG